MIGKIIGAAIGKEIDQRDGKGGVKGAAFGWLAAGALRRAGPLGVALGGAWLAKRVYDRRKADRIRPLE